MARAGAARRALGRAANVRLRPPRHTVMAKKCAAGTRTPACQELPCVRASGAPRARRTRTTDRTDAQHGGLTAGTLTEDRRFSHTIVHAPPPPCLPHTRAFPVRVTTPGGGGGGGAYVTISQSNAPRFSQRSNKRPAKRGARHIAKRKPSSLPCCAAPRRSRAHSRGLPLAALHTLPLFTQPAPCQLAAATIMSIMHS